MIIALLRALHSSYVGHFVESPLPAVRQWGTALMVERYCLPSYVRGASDYGKNLTSSSRPVCLWIMDHFHNDNNYSLHCVGLYHERRST
jgi:hypothetical protein